MKPIHKITSSIIIALFLSTLVGYSNNIDKGKHKKTRTIKKEFSVSKDNTLNIDNRYGDLTITTWNENTINIEVTITVSSDNEEYAEKKFNAIDVEFRQDNNTVFAKTIINKTKSVWSFFGGNTSVNTKIDYVVKMPVSNNVDLDNDYGSIYLDRLEGICKIDCDYGGLNIGELHNKMNTINMDYGRSSSIDFINNADINTDYSKLAIEKANTIDLNADYSQLEITEVEKIVYSNDYGSLKINEADEISGNGDYLTLKVYELTDLFDVSSDYGSIKIYKLVNDFNKVIVDGEFTSVKIGVSNDASFNFEAQTSYAGIDFEDLDVDFTLKEDKMSSKKYMGNINGSNSNSILRVTSSYGGIKIYKSEE